MKKILFILAILFLLILLGLGLFLFFGGNKNTVSDFFDANNDFGSFFDANPQSQNDTVTESEIPVDQTSTESKFVAPVLRQLSFEPVSGFTFYATTSTSTRESAAGIEEFLATSTVVRFQERATGHLFDVFEFIPTPEKVSNITVQKIYNTIFTNNVNEFLEQTPTFNSEQIKTVFAKNIPAQQSGTSTPQEQRLDQRDISTTISDFIFIKQTNKLIYSIKTGDSSNVYTSDTQRNNEILIGNIPFSEFTLEPINNSYVLLQTKASAAAVGYAYTLNISTGVLTKFIGNVSGLLTKVSPNLNYYLYIESNQGRPITRGYDATTGITRRIGLDTIPEKCSFSEKNNAILYCFGSLQYKSATYPDDWYKGKVFNDEDLYKIDLSTGIVEVVYVFGEEETLVDFDVIKPLTTFNDNFIVFQNKNDLTLWSIHLEALNNQF
jgi:hypothetical protein